MVVVVEEEEEAEQEATLAVAGEGVGVGVTVTVTPTVTLAAGGDPLHSIDNLVILDMSPDKPETHLTRHPTLMARCIAIMLTTTRPLLRLIPPWLRLDATFVPTLPSLSRSTKQIVT